MRLQVIVGNIGIVYDGNSELLALQTFDDYVGLSASGYGRCSGEPVTLTSDNGVEKEYPGARANDDIDEDI